MAFLFSIVRSVWSDPVATAAPFDKTRQRFATRRARSAEARRVVTALRLLQQAKRDLDLQTAMTRLDKYRVVIIDDIGYVKKTDAETQVLFEFIAHRYESGSLIITANQPFSAWDQIFPDAIMTVAAIDRLIHHGSIIELNGESYRKQQRMEESAR